MPELTRIQQQVFDFIIEQKEKKGMPPTLSEIAQKFNYKTRATAQQHVDSIIKKGYIKRNPRLSRGLEIVNDGLFNLHRVIGEAAAGNPSTIYPEPIDSVMLPAISRIPQSSFLIRVKGDSLKDAHIFNGDIIIVNPAKEPVNGQIVVAIIDDAALVKRFYKKENIIEFRSENPDYEPIILDYKKSNFRIVGVVIGIYRKMD
jgi:repressor LexA